ncbi:unnamed protein product [Dracunculus medinensis]|uniref:Monocarboxylate transporter n=1 Tax=Dracunculus medinensis TaxID=318479 RepID=A0A0N4ULC5_DRAME|nr:unnamed protein product [Dracunculus medinensis]
MDRSADEFVMERSASESIVDKSAGESAVDKSAAKCAATSNIAKFNQRMIINKLLGDWFNDWFLTDEGFAIVLSATS